MNERDMQASIIAECDLRANQEGEWGMIFAIPNGQYRKGQRMEPGLRSGIPDLFLPVSRSGYSGLFIELKVGRNQATREQKIWMANLLQLGYYVAEVRDDPTEAIKLIEWYLGKSDDE